MKAFSDAYIEKLNAEHSGGVFLKAATLSESESVTRYFVDHQRSIVYQGNTYQPLAMRWDGIEMNARMSLPAVRLSIPNIGGEVIEYLETIDILGRDITLQLLHNDLLGETGAVDEVVLQIMAIEGNLEVVTFTLGLNLALTEMLPRDVMTRAEFPGIPDDIRRASIL